MRRSLILLALLSPLAALPALAHPSEVFISEYVEGSGNNKAVELYNGTGSSIDLGGIGLNLCIFTNGAPSPTSCIAPIGIVAPGAVHVLAHASADPALQAQANQLSSFLDFDGNDALELRKGSITGPTIDSLGQVGSNPGTEWGTGDQSTADNTLRRKPGECHGDTTPNDTFDPAIEWDGFAADTFVGLGSHTVTCGSDTAFTPGNLVIYRVGTGTAGLIANGTAVFLDEYTTAGVLVHTLNVPTTTVGAQRRLVASGTATSEGYLTRSTDGQYVVFSGYDAAVGTASITGSTSASVPRVIGRVDAGGILDTSTALADAISGGNPRGATSTNGTDLWISGTSSGGGVRYATLGATTSTQIPAAGSQTNLRATNIFGGQLFVSAASGTGATFTRIATVGTGTPTTAGQTLTNLPGLTGPPTSPYGFFFADLDAGVAGLDTLYLADDAGTIQKYSFVSPNWVANGTVALASVRGLTATVSGTTVTLYVTNRTTLRTLTDTSGYNATITGTLSTLATAATNTAMQGVAFVPVVAQPSLTIDDVSEDENADGTFTFTVSLSAPAGPGGVTFDIATADGTAQDDNPPAEDNDYVANSLTGQTIPSGSSTYTFDVTVNGDTTFEPNETFFVNVTNVTGATILDGQGQGTIQNDDACATLSIDNVSQPEGDSGTSTFTFTVSLSNPANDCSGTVEFDIGTQDNTATTADNDYLANGANDQTITGSGTTYTFDVTVNGDTTVEPDQTFFVNVSNVFPANVQVNDNQGLGTIENDDFTPIHDIQGPGGSSPIAGSSVTTRGIVTGLKNNGYFIQEPDATVDADPATSEGIFVFTSSAPPAAAALGNLVQVTGTVAEFVPTQDQLQPPLTELTSPTTVQLSTGNPLPAPIPLTATFPDPAGPFDQLERLEGMRVSVASLTVGGPTLGNTNEPNATSTSTGVFYGTVTGVQRAFREAGIQAPDPAPSGSIPPIPRFDSNPEVLRVDGDGVGGPILDVGTSAVVTGLVGPLDYGFRRYTILPDAAPAPPPVAAGGPTATVAATPTAKELTVASYNLERFFDTVNDPGIGEPVLTAAAFNNRLNKASLGIRNHLKFPDILGVVEVENLSTLQALAARISADAIAAAQPDPQYAAYLEEGNDVGGIDVGFLVKTAVVTGATPRVTVNAVVQENAGELFVNADSSTELLNDRPSLRLDAVINHPNGASFPVTVIVNHLRSLNDVNNIAAGSSGWATVGDRVRAKRQKQAESLANLVQARQTADPSERIILVGDFNAFEFNDGLGDSMNVITGTPPPDNETAVPGDGVDLVNPDLFNLVATPPPPERYSFVFDGNAQNLDHIVVNAALGNSTVAERIEHPRINADFPAVDRNDPNTPRHLSDHDPVVGFFEVATFATADLSITKTDGVTTAVPGGSVTYTITASNAGPDPVTGGSVTDTFPAILTCTWTCVGAGGGTCTAAGSGDISDTVDLPVGGSVTYTASCTIAASATGTLENTAEVSGGAVGDPDTNNNSQTDTDDLTPQADLGITKTDGVSEFGLGDSLTYTIIASNAGPSDAPGATVTDIFPAELTCTWTCVGAGGGTCTAAGSGNISDTVNLPAGGSVTYTASCTVDALPSGTLDNTASVAAPAGVTDPDGDNNSQTDSDTLTSGSSYFTVGPCRVVDTRFGAPLQDGVPQTFALHGVCGIPVTARQVVLNLTVVDPTGEGDLTVHASDATPPAFATMPFPANRIRSLFATVALSDDAAGEVTVQPAVAGSGTVPLVLDVVGYFE